MIDKKKMIGGSQFFEFETIEANDNCEGVILKFKGHTIEIEKSDWNDYRLRIKVDDVIVEGEW